MERIMLKKIFLLLIISVTVFGCADDETNVETFHDVKWEEIAHYLPAEYPVPYLKDNRSHISGTYEFIDKVEIEKKDQVIYLNIYIYDTDNSHIRYGAYNSYINKITPFYTNFTQNECNTIKSETRCNIYGCLTDKHIQCDSSGLSEHHDLQIFYENNDFNYYQEYIHFKFIIKP